MTRLTTCADAEAVAARAADEVRRALQAAREARRTVQVALSGGRSPQRAFALLARAPAEWEHVELWFADERCVEPGDAESNYRLVAEELVQPAGIAPERVHRMLGELGAEQGASRYAAELLARVAPAGPERPPTLDLILLGIGEDGHVASLFPDAPTLSAAPDSVCLPVHDSPKPPPERITLSLGVLRAARRCMLLATGPDKAHAVAGMLGEPSPHVPASLLRRERLTVILDDAAAAETARR
ncbi:MAG TPA: 6-phosphogluconolactonase [Solirubrobacteraceae bacterium]|nr:6-phosphogluconolactonase [Solirubrobacteraceae bacterium]